MHTDEFHRLKADCIERARPLFEKVGLDPENINADPEARAKLSALYERADQEDQISEVNAALPVGCPREHRDYLAEGEAVGMPTADLLAIANDPLYEALWPDPGRPLPGKARALAQCPDFLTCSFENPYITQMLKYRIGLDSKPKMEKWLRSEIYPTAILLALGDIHEYQGKRGHIRIGKKWIMNDRGEVSRIRPRALPWESFRRWAQAKSRKHAKDLIAAWYTQKTASSRLENVYLRDESPDLQLDADAADAGAVDRTEYGARGANAPPPDGDDEDSDQGHENARPGDEAPDLLLGDPNADTDATDPRADRLCGNGRLERFDRADDDDHQDPDPDDSWREASPDDAKVTKGGAGWKRLSRDHLGAARVCWQYEQWQFFDKKSTTSAKIPAPKLGTAVYGQGALRRANVGPYSEIVRTIRTPRHRMAKKDAFLSSKVDRAFRQLRERFPRLPKREQQVAALLMTGHDAKEIAEKLGIKTGSVCVYLTRLRKKLKPPS